MDQIEEGEFFPTHTENRKDAMKYLLRKLKNGPRDKGNLVRNLFDEDIYSQKKDCKDFIQNLVNSSNHEVMEIGRRRVSLTRKSEVTAE